MTQEKQKYEFGGYLSADFPSQFIVDVTEICNYECIHCPHPEFKKSQHFTNKMLEPELNKKLIDEIGEHGKGITQYVRYAAQGEPIAHPKLFEMVKYASDHCDASINLTTNGFLLNKKRAEQAVDAGIDVYDVSIDAFKPETYAKVRVKGILSVVIENVRNLLKLRDQGGKKFKVITSFVRQDFNMNEADDFRKFWEDEGIDHVVIRELHSCSGAKEGVAEVRRGKNPDRRPCLYPWERMSLGPDGWLHFCPQDWVHGSRIADYRKKTVKELWQGEFYTALRKAHLTNNYEGWGFCGQCPDWSATQWPSSEKKSYAKLMSELTK
jgi:MoaA/NifB/PqqE/SkfB family radical SAM enzyme